MSEVIPIRMATLERPLEDSRLLGTRVRHREYSTLGRLTGRYREDRGIWWFEVDTNAGRYWWGEPNVVELGPIPVPAA